MANFWNSINKQQEEEMLYSEAIFESSMVKDNILFERNHPFFPDWNEWLFVSANYHSPRTTKLQDMINRGFRDYHVGCMSPINEWIVDEVYFQSNYIQSVAYAENCNVSRKSIWFRSWFENAFYEPRKPYVMAGVCKCTDYTEDYFKFPVCTVSSVEVARWS